jgi:hypothetical protein
MLSIVKCLGTGFGGMAVDALSLEDGAVDFVGLGIVASLISLIVLASVQFGYKKEVPRETRKIYREWVEGQKRISHREERLQEATT